jgi:hypothetical protein
MKVNKHGLSRYLSPIIKREVRKRCGFGCVVCGTAIIQYHHFEPEFVDATEHVPNGITLLCSNCHEKVKKNLFDYDFIVSKNQKPYCTNSGFAKDIFYVGSEAITFKLGKAWFKRLDIILYNNHPIISFSPPEMKDGPILLNTVLYDENESELLKIIDNEFIIGTHHYDVETTSNQLVIREKAGKINFKLTQIANKEIAIQKIDMNYKGFKIKVKNEMFIVNSPSGSRLMLSCPNILATLKLFSNGEICVG